MDMLDIAVRIIEKEEGYLPEVYLDSLSFPTVGIGLKVGAHGQPLEDFYGFPDMPLEVAQLWCKLHAEKVVDDLRWFPQIQEALEECNDVQKAVLVSMGYQLGLWGLSKFKRMLGRCIMRDFKGASLEMMDSLLAQQTPNRTERQALMLKTGVLLPHYGDIK